MKIKKLSKIIIIILAILGISTCICFGIAGHAVRHSDTPERIHSGIQKMLDKLNIKHCAITGLVDYSGGPFIRVLTPTITDKEYNEYI